MSIKNFFDGGKQISDSTGAPLNGGLCYFYDPTTTTPKNTYTTSAISVANANPVVLDSSGRANIWLNGNYRVIVKDSAGNTIYDEDLINPETATTVTSITTNTTLTATNKGNVIEVNGASITVTLTAAATLGAGWYVDYISTDSTNTFTFGRANTGNTINGSAANLTVYPLQAGRIWVNQAANGFYTEGDITGRGDNVFSGVLIAKLPMASNLSLAASVGSSALTFSLKGNDGNDPSATNIGYLPFRNVTATTGTTVWLPINTATSLVISSGSTLGTTSAVISRTWIVGFNDGSTFRLGAINCSTANNVYPLSSDMLASSTAEGGAGAADSAGVIYTGTAVSTKAMIILGYIESTQATAGTWATSPSKMQPYVLGMKLPGDPVQHSWKIKTDTFGTTSTAFVTVTGVDPAITPTSAINLIRLECNYFLSHDDAANTAYLRLVRNSTAIAVGATAGSRISCSVAYRGTVGDYECGTITYIDTPYSTSAITYALQARTEAANNAYVNRTGTDSDSATYGRGSTYMCATEIMG